MTEGTKCRDERNTKGARLLEITVDVDGVTPVDPMGSLVAFCEGCCVSRDTTRECANVSDL